MNGWQRLGVTLATPVVLFMAYVGYEENSHGFAMNIVPSAQISGLGGKPFYDALWQENKTRPGLEGCDPATVKFESSETVGYFANCDYTAHAKFDGVVWWGGLTALALYMLGQVIGWIYKGFRPD